MKGLLHQGLREHGVMPVELRLGVNATSRSFSPEERISG